MKILIFGAAGQVGTDCLNTLTSSTVNTSDEPIDEIIALTRAEVDFADSDMVANMVIDVNPDIVINTCAYTAVDKAESERDLVNQINGRSVAALASACDKVGSVLIHLSTDYVFNGDADQPYTEISEVSPLGAYGSSKYLGEQGIVNTMRRFIILRTSWVFGDHGNNFVKTMLRLGAEKDRLGVVGDQYGRPTYAKHIADVIAGLVAQLRYDDELPWGIYHCSSQGESSWYEFAQVIFLMAQERGVLERLPVVDAISSSAYPTVAPRPKYSVLHTGKLESLLEMSLPTWQEGLGHFFDNLNSASLP